MNVGVGFSGLIGPTGLGGRVSTVNGRVVVLNGLPGFAGKVVVVGGVVG